MVFFADKRKNPVSIYKKGTATEKAQSKMNKNVGRVFQGAANIADKYVGGAGARAVINPVISARAKQTQFLFNDRLNRNRTRPEDRGKVAALLGNKSKLVGGNMPVKKPQARAPLQMLPTTHNSSPVKNKPSLINEQPNSRRDQELGKMTATSKLTSNGGEKRTFNIGGNTLSYNLSKNDTAARGNASQTNTRQNPNGVHKLGNLNVQFAPSVDPAARKRFLADPVRPTAQINRFAQREQNQVLQERAPSRELFTKKNAPDMDYRERKVLNLQILSNRQSGVNNRNNNATLTRNAAGRNAVDMANVNSQISGRNLDNKAKQIGIDQQKNVQSMIKAYDDEPDQGKKKALRQKLISRGIFKQPSAPKTFQETNSDADGNETTTTYAFNPDGTVRRAIPEQLAPPPPNPNDRVVGTPYQTRMGKMYWNGKGYVKTKPQVSR